MLNMGVSMQQSQMASHHQMQQQMHAGLASQNMMSNGPDKGMHSDLGSMDANSN